jgi:hypothetical protein
MHDSLSTALVVSGGAWDGRTDETAGDTSVLGVAIAVRQALLMRLLCCGRLTARSSAAESDSSAHSCNILDRAAVVSSEIHIRAFALSETCASATSAVQPHIRRDRPRHASSSTQIDAEAHGGRRA